MIRTALIACAALMSTTAGPALAGDASTSRAAPDAHAARATSQRMVATCERDPLTQAAFRSQYGPRPVFMTAEQVVSSAGERWSAPRCMSLREQQRLARMINSR